MKNQQNMALKCSPAVRVALDFFVETVQQAWHNHYQRPGKYSGFTPTPTLELDFGRKYIRVWRSDGNQRSAFCFIDNQTGDVLKAATWKAPAKHVRGTIMTMKIEDFGMGKDCFYVNYLR